MKTALIYLPRNDNAGLALPFVHTMLESDLLKAFGGFTVSDKTGAWRDSETGKIYREPVAVYEIAADWNSERENHLRGLAARYGAFAEQITVLITLASGESEFVAPRAETAATLADMRAEKQAA